MTSAFILFLHLELIFLASAFTASATYSFGIRSGHIFIVCIKSIGTLERIINNTDQIGSFNINNNNENIIVLSDESNGSNEININKGYISLSDQMNHMKIIVN